MNKTEAIELILKELSGSLSPAEAVTLQAWLAGNPENPAVKAHIVQLHHADWRSVRPSPGPDFLEAQRTVLRLRAMQLEARKRKKDVLLRGAAVVTLAILASLFVYFTAFHSFNTERRLSFSHTRLPRVACMLERAYGITIDASDEQVRTLRFTGVFVNEDADRVLAALRITLPLEIDQNRGIYVFRARN
jgi:ferric-dicitrate binding protein FerR (iron transport regulator)